MRRVVLLSIKPDLTPHPPFSNHIPLTISYLLKQQFRPLGSKLQHRLGEDAIRPREPRSRHTLARTGIGADSDVDALVDQAEDTDALDAGEAVEDFGGEGRGHCLHEEGDGPGAEEAGVGAADAVEGGTDEVVGVAGRVEEHAAGVIVDLGGFVVCVCRRGGGGGKAEEWEGEERRNIGIVH